MARTVAEINTYIVNQLVTNFAAEGITINPTLWSKTNVIRLLCYTVAVILSLAEQLQDIAIARMQAIQDISAAPSALWLQDAALKFQYSATTPQYLVMVNGSPQYPTVNPALRIVTACAVSSTVSNIVNVKAAKGTTTLAALSAPELSALDGYVSMKGAAGITYNVTSTASDKLYLEGTIYYQGVYSAVIEANVIASIDSYLLNLSKTRFGGDILMSDLETYVRGIEGVTDVVFDRVAVRYDSQALFGGVDLVLAGDWINRTFVFGSGYAIQETTAGSTFADKLTFIAE